MQIGTSHSFETEFVYSLELNPMHTCIRRNNAQERNQLDNFTKIHFLERAYLQKATL